MTKNRLMGLLALGAVIIFTTSTVQSVNPSLRALSVNTRVAIGAAVGADQLRNDPLYSQTLALEFSSLTTENALKFGELSSSRGNYNFANADAIIGFAEANGMKIRGHTLIWFQQQPSWLTNGQFSRDEWIAILQQHISTVVGHYRGRIGVWDVVNEAIDNDKLRDTMWMRGIGPEHIDMAFRFAHEADPGAKLFYNDYGGEGLGTKSDAIYNLVAGMVQRGVPINGVGFQMHVGLDWYPKPEDVAANMARYAALGLEVQITEMDVRIQNGTGTTQERYQAQASVYNQMLDVCLKASNCTSFTTWGFTDRYSWIPQFTGREDAPLLFDQNYNPKPAYDSLVGLLMAQSPTPTQLPPPPDPVEPAIRIDITPNSATVGGSVEAQLKLFNVTDVFGLQAVCQVDPNILTGTNLSGGAGFTTSNSFLVDKGYNAADGTWLVAASILQPNPALSGNVHALTLGYTVNNNGSTSVNCSVVAVDNRGRDIALQVINGSYNGSPTVVNTPVPVTPTVVVQATPTAPPVVAQSGSINGTITYQTKPINSGIQVKLLSNNSVVTEATTGDNGTYNFADVPVGTYNLLADGPSHLAVSKDNITLQAGIQLDLGTYALVAGDTDDNNVVDLADASLIGANFGLQSPPSPTSADLNGDSQITIYDLVLVGSNFNLTGPVALTD